MKKFLAASAAAVAMAAFASPAFAVTDLGTTDLTASDVDPAADVFYSLFNYTAGPNTLVADASGFQKTFTFNFPGTGTGAGSATASLVKGANTLFKSITLNGAMFDLSDDFQQAILKAGPVNGGVNSLVVTFNVLDTKKLAGFSGDISAAIPEPATWAMMILGIGFAGAAMRRRQKVSVRYA